MDDVAYKVERDGWPAGPWDDEGDREEWKTRAGFPGLIVRNRMGSWCGYVAVPPGHPYYGRGYDDVDVEVHGGLTYAAKCFGHICHVPEPGEPDDVWWLGFDCGHWMDISPDLLAVELRYESLRRELDLELRHYRPTAYVRAEVERLAEQLLSPMEVDSEG